jgi:hypothetical protein
MDMSMIDKEEIRVIEENDLTKNLYKIQLSPPHRISFQ